MKIFAFADLHGNESRLKKIKKKARDSDVIICAGDLTVFENDMDYFLNELDMIEKRVLMLHGNHEGMSTMKKECKKYKNIDFLHKKVEEIDGVLFIGYGGEGFSFEDKVFEKFGKSIEKKIKKFKGKKILVTHAPPYGTRLDKLSQGHVGNISFREFILKNDLDLVICGHLHENENKKDKLGNVVILNPGIKGKIIKI